MVRYTNIFYRESKQILPQTNKCVLVATVFNTLPHMPILGSSNSAANKDMMSNIWTNGVQSSDWVENIVGKGEIARDEQFLLFP